MMPLRKKPFKNIVRKEENVLSYINLLPANTFNLDMAKIWLFGKELTLYSILMHQQQTAFENIVGKEEIARNEQFLLFPQCFLLNQKIMSLFVHIFDIISLFAAELEEPKIGIRSKGFNNRVACMQPV